MSVFIEQNKCVGCGRCAEVCPGNLLQIKNGRAHIRDVRDCWGCCACVKECPKNAIFYYLAADLGGAGGRLYADDTPQTIAWTIERADGATENIVVDKRQSNEY